MTTDSHPLFHQQLEQYRLRIEEGLGQWLPPAEEPPVRLHRAMRYSLEAGGKRLRPVLVLSVAEALGARLDAVPAAVALECIHTYSLIHDDLPAMDNSILRRGRPSCHVAFDEATAILAGDALLTEAFALLARAYASVPVIASALTGVLGEAAGSRQLIAGQAGDIAAEDDPPRSLEGLNWIHRRKTAALMRAAFQMGGIAAEAEPEVIARLGEAGDLLGLAFQFVDDLLDATGDESELGKSTGQDLANRKATALTFLTIEEARTEVDRLTAACTEELHCIAGETGFLQALAENLRERVT